MDTRQIVSTKLATGSEGSTLTGMSGFVGAVVKAMYVFRGNVAASSLTVASVNGQQTSGNPTSQTVTASTGVAPLVVIGCYGSFGLISPRTFSLAKDGELNSTISSPFRMDIYIAYKIYNSSPANVSIDMDDEEELNILQSFYVTLTA